MGGGARSWNASTLRIQTEGDCLSVAGGGGLRLVPCAAVEGNGSEDKRPTRVIYINIKIQDYKTYKNYKIWNMQFIHNTKLKIVFFFTVFLFRNFPDNRKYFGVFCTINRYFEYRIRILCI